MVRNIRIRLDHLLVCLSVGRSAKCIAAEQIWMPFGVVSGVGQGMGVFDGVGYRQRGRGSLGMNVRRPTVTNGAFVA